MANSSQGSDKWNRTIIIPPGALNPNEINVVYIPPCLHNTTHPLLVRPAPGRNRSLQAHSLPIWDDEYSKRDDDQNQSRSTVSGNSGNKEDLYASGYMTDISNPPSPGANVDFRTTCSNTTGPRIPNVTHMSSSTVKTSSAAPTEGHSIVIDAPQGVDARSLEKILQRDVNTMQTPPANKPADIPPMDRSYVASPTARGPQRMNMSDPRERTNEQVNAEVASRPPLSASKCKCPSNSENSGPNFGSSDRSGQAPPSPNVNNMQTPPMDRTYAAPPSARGPQGTNLSDRRERTNAQVNRSIAADPNYGRYDRSGQASPPSPTGLTKQPCPPTCPSWQNRKGGRCNIGLQAANATFASPTAGGGAPAANATFASTPATNETSAGSTTGSSVPAADATVCRPPGPNEIIVPHPMDRSYVMPPAGHRQLLNASDPLEYITIRQREEAIASRPPLNAECSQRSDYDEFDPYFVSSDRSATPESFYDDMYDSHPFDDTPYDPNKPIVDESVAAHGGYNRKIDERSSPANQTNRTCAGSCSNNASRPQSANNTGVRSANNTGVRSPEGQGASQPPAAFRSPAGQGAPSARQGSDSGVANNLNVVSSTPPSAGRGAPQACVCNTPPGGGAPAVNAMVARSPAGGGSSADSSIFGLSSTEGGPPAADATICRPPGPNEIIVPHPMDRSYVMPPAGHRQLLNASDPLEYITIRQREEAIVSRPPLNADCSQRSDYDEFDPYFVSSDRSATAESFYDEMYDSQPFDDTTFDPNRPIVDESVAAHGGYNRKIDDGSSPAERTCAGPCSNSASRPQSANNTGVRSPEGQDASPAGVSQQGIDPGAFNRITENNLTVASIGREQPPNFGPFADPLARYGEVAPMDRSYVMPPAGRGQVLNSSDPLEYLRTNRQMAEAIGSRPPLDVPCPCSPNYDNFDPHYVSTDHSDFTIHSYDFANPAFEGTPQSVYSSFNTDDLEATNIPQRNAGVSQQGIHSGAFNRIPGNNLAVASIGREQPPDFGPLADPFARYGEVAPMNRSYVMPPAGRGQVLNSSDPLEYLRTNRQMAEAIGSRPPLDVACPCSPNYDNFDPHYMSTDHSDFTIPSYDFANVVFDETPQNVYSTFNTDDLEATKQKACSLSCPSGSCFPAGRQKLHKTL